MRRHFCDVPATPLRWGWGDRLCAAHFAMIMFGLVALVGPAHGAGAMLLAVGLVAVMCLAVHGALLVGSYACMRMWSAVEVWILPCVALVDDMLLFLRRASQLAGAPPAAESWQIIFQVRTGGESGNAFASAYFSGGEACP